MFIPDFETYYAWDGTSPAVEGLAVGWLGDKFNFKTEPPDRDYLHKLAKLCRNPVNKEQGFYKCQLCGLNPMEKTDAFFIEYGTHLGNGEIIVKNAGLFYIAPTLVLHYVKDHLYRAPEPFIEGVMQAP